MYSFAVKGDAKNTHGMGRETGSIFPDGARLTFAWFALFSRRPYYPRGSHCNSCSKDDYDIT